MDYELFKFKDIAYIKSIILDNPVTDNIVIYKKITILNKLIDSNYDSEIDIISENFNYSNIMNKINHIYNNKIVYTGIAYNNSAEYDIVKISSNVFNDENDNIKLKELTNNYTYYSWWCDLSVFKREYLKDFFSKITINNYIRCHFDQVIYLNYLILYHNWKFFNLQTIIPINRYSLELYYTKDINELIKLKENNYSFAWLNFTIFNNYKEYLINNGMFMIFHLDRYW